MKRFVLILILAISLTGCSYLETIPQNDLMSAGLFVSNSVMDAALLNPEWDRVQISREILDSVLKVSKNSALQIKDIFNFIQGTENYKKLVLEDSNYEIAFKILRRRIETRVKLIKIPINPVTETGHKNLINFLTVIREGLN